MRGSEARGAWRPRAYISTVAVLLLVFALATEAGEVEAAWGRIQIFDPAPGQLVFDSGVVRVGDLAERAERALDTDGDLTFELRIWSTDGSLMVSRGSGTGELNDLIAAIDFEALSNVDMVGSAIVLDGTVETSGSLTVATTLSASSFEGSDSSPFFDSCAVGSALRVLGSDGTVDCEPIGGSGSDGLGNHTATENMKMAGYWLSNDGDPEGIFVSPDGAVGIGNTAPIESLDIAGNIRLEAGANITFGAGADTRIVAYDGSITLFAHLDDRSDIELSAEDNIEIESHQDIFIIPDDDLFIAAKDGVAFGNVDDPSRLIEVEQGTSRDPIADQWDTYSSRRWKLDIRSIEEPLELLAQIEGVRYRSRISGDEEIGLIAESVGRVLPEVVTWEEEGTWAESIAYGRLVALLVEAGKEQTRRLEVLQFELERLKQRLEEMR